MFSFLLPFFFVFKFTMPSPSGISVYGDVYENTDFFTKTMPWIIDNIGGDISVDYYLVGSGRHGVPQMCAVEALKKNPFLQADYLKCEAEGNPSEYCLCESGIDRDHFKHCVTHRGDLAGHATTKFSELGLRETPAIEYIPRSAIASVQHTEFLQKICSVFDKNPPMGCLQPSTYQTGLNQIKRKAVAHFDNCCKKLWGSSFVQPAAFIGTTMAPLISSSGFVSTSRPATMPPSVISSAPAPDPTTPVTTTITNHV